MEIQPNPRDHKELLFPPFAVQLRAFEERLHDAGLLFYLFCGLRTWDEQAAEYAKGRTTPGPPCAHKGESRPRPVGSCPMHPLGNIVTKARPGESWHCFGLAADYVLDGMIEKPGIQWSWNLKADLNADGHNDWEQMAQIAKECGLESAWYWVNFPEAPHVQNRFGLTLAQAQGFFAIGGLARVWQEITDTERKRLGLT
jgi:peptidoglycan L-alanyl-D-glutamate endopeptidase CwlK